MTQLYELANLGSYQTMVDAALADMAAQRVMQRIWAHDYTVWKPEPTEITNRLGWLHSAAAMRERVPELLGLVEAVRVAGYTHVLLLGMGGSSLAPDLFSKVFRTDDSTSLIHGLELAVLDSTDPGAVLAQAERLEPERTLVIVSTKSGGTVETSSLFKYFYNWMVAAGGAERAGQHFVAITDPGRGLAQSAQQLHFRATFLNDPNIGGRYSALSCFGLVPAALVGVDVPRLLERAIAAAEDSAPSVSTGSNPGAWLGALLGELAKAGRDKTTFVTSPQVASFGDWVEQLIAESTGKEGRGILPVVGEPLGSPDAYGEDRFFVELRLSGRSGASGEAEHAALAALQASGFPVLHIDLRDVYDLGGQFFLWELATAVAGQRLAVNPFDQPNVEAAKVRAREMVAAYVQTGALPSETPALTGDGMAVFGGVVGSSPADALNTFLGQAQPGAYIALQAYVQPTAETDAALLALRTRLRDRRRLATTVGYGPRFLHSTGQLHKGDAGHGFFIQFTADDMRDAPIPDEVGSPASSITFGVLKAAQALGDRQALLDAGRQAIRFHLGTDAVAGLQRLANAVR